MKHFSARYFFLAMALLSPLLLSGCGSMRSYDRELSQTMSKAASGQPEQALLELEKNNQSEDKDLLYFFEKGQLLNIMGKFGQSRDTWLMADDKIKIWEAEVKTDPNKFLGDVGSVLVNDKTRRYDGQDFEKVMLSTKLAMNHLQIHDFDAARIEIKKAHEREAIIADLRAKELAKVESAAKDKKVTTELKDLKGYPVETLNDPEVTRLKNSYQSAFSHYLAGFVYEALGEPSLAAPGYRTAIELRPDIKWLEDGLANLETRRKTLKANDTDVLFVVETGAIPARQSINFPIPTFAGGRMIAVPISFPVIRPERTTSLPGQLMLDGQIPLDIVPATSLTAMAVRALKDDMPGILLRGAIRAVTKAATQKLAQETHILVQLAVTVGTVITESADERGWRTLPSHILLGRATLPAGKHSITIATPSGPKTASVDIAGKHALVAMRLMGDKLYLQQPEISTQMRVASAVIAPEPPLPALPASKPEKKGQTGKSKKEVPHSPAPRKEGVVPEIVETADRPATKLGPPPPAVSPAASSTPPERQGVSQKPPIETTTKNIDKPNPITDDEKIAPKPAKVAVEAKAISPDPPVVKPAPGKELPLASNTSPAPLPEERKQGVAAVSPASDPKNVLPAEKPKEYVDPFTKMEFVFVKGGCYTMGDIFDEGFAPERPTHQVCVDDFYIGKYEVTQEEYQKVPGMNPSLTRKGERYPVDSISWQHAQLFLTKLQVLTGKTYRLPTEAEWEYAARSGGKAEKYSGGAAIDRLAWYSENSQGGIHPVGLKRANGLGLYDMTGNVWEWCGDWYGTRYYSDIPQHNPVGPSEGNGRVQRGGGWDSSRKKARTMHRDAYDPEKSYHNLGLRIVLPVDQR